MKLLKPSSKPILKNRSLLIVAMLFMFATPTIAQTAVGGGLGYNEKISGPGITLKGVFNITDNIAISPSASYFFGSEVFGYNRNLLAGDINAHYYFNIIESKLNVYPVVGANFSSYKTGNSYYDIYYDYETEEITDNAFGANIGAGATWAFTEKLKVYLEPKYVVSDFSQVVINAGVLLNL
ncbi:porin family protein [Lacinutrix sp. C3R15]|nr:porin family protein [Lacinutrix sp. C3R15]